VAEIVCIVTNYSYICDSISRKILDKFIEIRRLTEMFEYFIRWSNNKGGLRLSTLARGGLSDGHINFKDAMTPK